MSKNMYGLPNHIYLVLGGFKYTSDPNGLIANVLDEHAPALEFQRCMDEDAWLTLQAAHPSAGGITQLTVGPEEGERRGLDARVNIEKLHPSPVPRLVHVTGHERICGIGRRAGRIPVQQLPLLVVERAEPVQDLSEIDRKVLRLAGAHAPQVGHGDGLRHQRNTCHGGQGPGARDNGVATREADRTARITRRVAGDGEHLLERGHRIDGAIVGDAVSQSFADAGLDRRHGDSLYFDVSGRTQGSAFAADFIARSWVRTSSRARVISSSDRPVSSSSIPRTASERTSGVNDRSPRSRHQLSIGGPRCSST